MVLKIFYIVNLPVNKYSWAITEKICVNLCASVVFINYEQCFFNSKTR